MVGFYCTVPVLDFSSSIILSPSWSGLVNWQSRSAVSTVITDILSARFLWGISRWLSNRSMLCLPVQRPSTSSISGIIASGAGSSAIDEDKLRVHIKFIYQQPVLFAMHLLKILSTIFCTAQVLLLCVKSRLPPLHNYSEIDSIVLPIRKKNWLVLKWYFSRWFWH